MSFVLALLFTRARSGAYEVHVTSAPTGATPSENFKPPAEAMLERLRGHMGASRGRTETPGDDTEGPLQEFGAALFDAVFTGAIYNAFVDARTAARTGRQTLELQLHTNTAPELAVLPWEFLYDSREHQFLVRSGDVTINRFLALPRAVTPYPLLPPLRILVLIALPRDQVALKARTEADNMRRDLSALAAAGVLTIDATDGGTAQHLRDALRSHEYHALHFIGHGGVGEDGEGIVYFEDKDGGSDPVRASTLAEWLGAHRSLRLVVLNTCEGARPSRTDPFSGTAQRLVQSGVPVVVGMQYAVSDEAAVQFAGDFYLSIASHAAVDDAVDAGRRAIVVNRVEWGTPVLYLRSRHPFVTPPPLVTRGLMRSAAGRWLVDRLGLARAGEPLTVFTWGLLSATAAGAGTALLVVDSYLQWFNLAVVPGLDRAIVAGDACAIVVALGAIGAATFAAPFATTRRIAITKVGFPATGRLLIYVVAVAVGAGWLNRIPPPLAVSLCEGQLPVAGKVWKWLIDAPDPKNRVEKAYRRIGWFVGSGNTAEDRRIELRIEPAAHVQLDQAQIHAGTATKSGCTQRISCSVEGLLTRTEDAALLFTIGTQATKGALSQYVDHTTTTVRVIDARGRTVVARSFPSPPLFDSAAGAVQCLAAQ